MEVLQSGDNSFRSEWTSDTTMGMVDVAQGPLSSHQMTSAKPVFLPNRPQNYDMAIPTSAPTSIKLSYKMQNMQHAMKLN